MLASFNMYLVKICIIYEKNCNMKVEKEKKREAFFSTFSTVVKKKVITKIYKIIMIIKNILKKVFFSFYCIFKTFSLNFI